LGHRTKLVIGLLLVCLAGRLLAGPRVAFIIDDLGYDPIAGREAIALPGQITYSFLPNTPFAERLAQQAHLHGKEVMLHLPMEAILESPLGPGGLTLGLSKSELSRILDEDLASIPHAVGVNNHMGSLLTQHPEVMAWLMQCLKDKEQLYFIDSRTNEQTVAEDQARLAGLPTGRRDIFLDNQQDSGYILQQIEQLLSLARSRGTAIGIGHPYPETIAVLAKVLPVLQEQGIELVPVSGLLQQQEVKGAEQWRAYSSPSPKVAKNLKQSH